MAVTVDKFELLPGPAPAVAPADPAAAKASNGTTSGPSLSRHELARALRLEADRAARTRAH